MDRIRTTALVAVIVASAFASPSTATAQVYQLSRVVVVGAARTSVAAVVGMTGLKPPTQVMAIDVERARQRLLDSGLFASVGYSFRRVGYSLIVTFTVQEPPWDSRILFDNFVWFTDEELVQAVARVLPGFMGLAPSLPRSLRLIAQALDALVHRAGILGSTTYIPASISGGGAGAYLFRIDLPKPMPVCAIEMEGVSPSMGTDARASVQLAVGQDYSRNFVQKVFTANLLPLYGRNGYLKAEYGAVRARTAAEDHCKSGVLVSVQVREGQSYRWAGATWSDASEPSHAELDAQLGLELGAVVDLGRFENGLQAIRERFTRQGYLVARTTNVFQYADEAGTASASITITRGPRVKMGTLEIQGLPSETVASLKPEWALAAGEYYDALYFKDYLRSVRAKYPAVLRAFPNVSVTTEPAGDSAVNVALTFSRN